jgi:hypothetical protein
VARRLYREVALTKVVTTIGKPGLAVASITRRNNGFVLAHVEGPICRCTMASALEVHPCHCTTVTDWSLLAPKCSSSRADQSLA